MDLFRTDSDTQMYSCSSTLIFFIDWDFSLGHMSMDLSSVLATLLSPVFPSVTGTSIQVASPQGCIPGLAGPKPSGPLNYPGQQLQARSNQSVSFGPFVFPPSPLDFFSGRFYPGGWWPLLHVPPRMIQSGLSVPG